MPKSATNSDLYRAGRRLCLHFAGDTPRLTAIEFQWGANAKGAPWNEVPDNTHEAPPKLDTPLPSALADFFVAFAAWAAGKRTVSFSYADQSKAKTIRNARDSTRQHVHKVFVTDKQDSCFNGLFLGSRLARQKKSRTPKHASHEQPHPIVLGLNRNLLPPDCLEIAWDEFGKTPLKSADQLDQLLRALRRDHNPARRDAPCPVDISRIIKYVPEELIGREVETALLNDAWAKARNLEPNRPHVLTFVALGGEGKTSLVTNWVVNEMLAKGWPGCAAAFAWSFYHQGTDEKTADSSDLFLKEALTFFGDDADKAFAASNAGAFEKGQRLARLVGQRPSLLILDGLEPLQYAPTSPTPGELKDQGVEALLKKLADSDQGLCVVTTRYSIPDLRAYSLTTAPEEKLLRLSQTAGVALLKKLRVKGNQKELENLVEDVKGHALTLNLLGTWLRDAHAGDIRKRDLVKLEEADAEEQGGHAFHVMDAYVKSLQTGGKAADENERGQRALALLRLLGLFDRPATADCLAALLKAPAIPGLTEPLVRMTEAQRNVALTRLESAKLVTVNWDVAGTLATLDAHPLIREYFARRLRQQPKAWRAAHRRLFDHLCATTKEGDQPTLEDLQPLYQAVAHGCQAGLQQEACEKVYSRRIRRGNENYSVHNLGAFGSDLRAIACFFETKWSQVLPLMTRDNRSLLFIEAGTMLRALGRQAEAVEVTQFGLHENVKTENWLGATQAACNLSEQKLTLGMVADAVQQAQLSVTYAERSGSVRRMVSSLTLLADALHQAGHRDEAGKCFGEVAELQNDHRLNFPPLFPLWHCLYYDFLLVDPERAAWQYVLQQHFDSDLSTVLDSCRTVAMSATKDLEKLVRAASAAWPLTVGLEHLTVGNASLYEAILRGKPLDRCCSSLQDAVKFLRRAGDSAHIPRGLLARAWLRSLTGAQTGSESAQSDLDDAWEIAERGPMPLFLADIHLHRARLFHAVNPYPWKSPQDDLFEAHRLIKKHGYLRRKEELEDAAAAAAHWPQTGGSRAERT